MTHRFPPPDHIELELTDAEEAQEWFDEWFGHWLSDQSDEGYAVALAEIERREIELRAMSRGYVPSLADSRSNARVA